MILRNVPALLLFPCPLEVLMALGYPEDMKAEKIFRHASIFDLQADKLNSG